MQDDRFYQRLGACMNLATAGATEGEKASGRAAVERLLAKLTPEERALLGSPVTGGTRSQPPPQSQAYHRPGTKRAAIADMLSKGYSAKHIAHVLGIKPQYVYRVKADIKRGL